MPYIILKDSESVSYAVSAKINLTAFAADLAREIGGTVQPQPEYPTQNQSIQVGTTMLFLSAINHKRKVNISAGCAGMKWGDWSTHDKAQAVDSISINPDGRKIASIAKDVKKRAIEANQAALQARRDYVAAQAKATSDGASVAEGLKKLAPSIDLRPESGGHGTFYLGKPYISGRWYPNGQITIDRVSSMSLETFAKIAKLLES